MQVSIAAATVLQLSALSFMAGCASQRVKLIHPQNGAVAECNASGIGWAAASVGRTLADCASQYERQGYIRQDDLTPEQSADLAKRGLLPTD